MSLRFFALLILGFMAAASATAQEAIRNRSVRIIEEGTPIESLIPGKPSSEASVNSGKIRPPLPSPDLPSQNSLQPSDTSGSLSAGSKPTMIPPVLTQADRDYENSAGLKLELMPSGDIVIGTQMSVRITSEKQGYLVVVDVDSEGHLTQIYPNTHSLATKEGAAANSNLLSKGKPRIIPDPKERATFQFVAAPPVGVGMLVAVLSDVPVQMIDLPDVPALMAGQKPALDYVRETTRQLRILPSSDRDSIKDPKWSFATQFYVIK